MLASLVARVVRTLFAVSASNNIIIHPDSLPRSQVLAEKLPRTRALAMGKQDFSLTCSIACQDSAGGRRVEACRGSVEASEAVDSS